MKSNEDQESYTKIRRISDGKRRGGCFLLAICMLYTCYIIMGIGGRFMIVILNGKVYPLGRDMCYDDLYFIKSVKNMVRNHVNEGRPKSTGPIK